LRQLVDIGLRKFLALFQGTAKGGRLDVKLQWLRRVGDWLERLDLGGQVIA